MPSNSRIEFEEAALQHVSVLYQTARCLLGNSAEAEDAVQETFLQAWRCFHKYTPGTNCRAWLYAILFNVIRQSRRKWTFRMSPIDDPDEFERTLQSRETIAEELTDREILRALDSIPEKYKEVVMLVDVQDFSYREVQETLRIPIGTVMSRLSRGRLALRTKLGDSARSYGLPPKRAMGTA